ncbi:MAG: hypothetical protein IJV74_02600 [Clostridia bacterium]|nr:hypothetical protein [Clostridia bacterium]
MKRILTLVLVLALALGAMTSCSMLQDILDKIEADLPNLPETPETPETPEEDEWDKTYDIITIAEAIEIATAAGEAATTERYYIRGTVKTLSNPAYGEMTITDGENEIYVYGTYSIDGALKYSELTEKAVAGDEVLLHCILSTYDGNPQVKNARLIDYKHVEVEIDPSEYPVATIAEARAAAVGTKVRVTGIVARITYANGMVPSGVVLVNGADSIYVYDGDVAGQVSIGNKIEVAASKTYWVLESEKNNADKFGYKGCNQLENAVLVSNDKGNNAWMSGEFETISVKDLLDTPVTEDITTQVYKVTALVKKVPGNGFTNYYFNDLDGTTGAYTYTQCNGNDFEWLDQFDGKICTVYLTVLNAKSSSTGCAWRLLPLAVVDEGYTFDVKDAPKFAVEYYGLGQFLSEYKGNPELELTTSVDSELLGFSGVTLTYSSSNESVVYFTTVDGKTVFNCGENGTATVTVTATHGNNTYSDTVTITVVPNAEYETIDIADAVDAEVGTEVWVRGIVGPSLVNRSGFYLFDETGMIAIIVNDTAVFEGLAIGQEVVIKGERDRFVKAENAATIAGQICISKATVEANYYGAHDYNTDFFITDKTLAEFYALDKGENHSTEVYVLKATVKLNETPYYTNLKLTDGTVELTLYCSSANQYNWLKAYAGQEITVEIAPCNWNDKSYYAGCVLAVVNEDGTKVYNTLNFDTYSK